MPSPRALLRRRRILAIASSLALVVGACGGGSGEPIETIAASDNDASPTPADAPAPDSEPGADLAAADDGVPPATEPDESDSPPDTDEPTTGSEAPAGPNDLPAVIVRDIATGDDVDLSAFAPGELPFVVWFWAPH